VPVQETCWIRRFLVKKIKISTLQGAAYTPFLDLATFFFSQKLNRLFKGNRFHLIEHFLGKEQTYLSSLKITLGSAEVTGTVLWSCE
jgi:hypothetical protein